LTKTTRKWAGDDDNNDEKAPKEAKAVATSDKPLDPNDPYVIPCSISFN
jgi:hypothetical protein